LISHVCADHRREYSITAQAIRSKGCNPRLYVYVPLPLAAAIGLEPGEQVQWTLIDRGTLQMKRAEAAAALPAKKPAPPARKNRRRENQLLKITPNTFSAESNYKELLKHAVGVAMVGAFLRALCVTSVRSVSKRSCQPHFAFSAPSALIVP